MMMTATDRRSAPRARYTGITFVNSGRDKIPGVASDLSESGMLLYLQQSASAEVGQDVKLTFTLPQASQWIEVDAQLVRQATIRKRVAWGVRFNAMSADVRRWVGDYVTNQEAFAEPSRPIAKAVKTPQPLPRGLRPGDALAPDETTPLTQQTTSVRDVPETPRHARIRPAGLARVATGPQPRRGRPTGRQTPRAKARKEYTTGPQPCLVDPPPIPPAARMAPPAGTKEIDPDELERLRLLNGDDETK